MLKAAERGEEETLLGCTDLIIKSPPISVCIAPKIVSPCAVDIFFFSHTSMEGLSGLKTISHICTVALNWLYY